MTHRRARARVSGLLVAAATGAVLALPATTAQAAVTGNAPAQTELLPAGTTVTLLTGDKVTIGGPNGVSVHAAPGREGVGFQSRTDERGDVHVVPGDAAAAVAAGRIDQRLFNVTELTRQGLDDAHRTGLPLIVDYPAAAPASATVGATVERELPSIGATVLRADSSGAFWPGVRSTAERIWLDGRVRASLDHSVPQIGAPAAWEAGYTGKGATVAVLDTGIDTKHPDLSDAVGAEKNFSDADSATDMFGHGTHVASIITGSGAADGGKYKGVAPDAKLLNGKVLNDGGSGAESWIIAGMEWAANGGADVINMSLGSPAPSDGTDPMSLAVNKLTQDTGVLFVISAGNSGPGDESIGSPGVADAALTVGAVDREDKLADFSSRGPRWGDGAIKPDITAPGVDIVAARGNGSEIGDPVGEQYMKLSGTSMAAPHVAGAAAILAGQHPDWAAGQLKPTLMGSAKPTDGLTVFEQGAGRVDVAAATTSTAYASPGSVSFGTAQWPHDDDEPIAKQVSYHNSGTEPLTLDVKADVRGPDGAAPPEGMFTVEPAQVTVPAGGEAAVTVTTHTKVEAKDGSYTGVLTATGGDTSVRTPIGVTREVESYNVKVNFLDHNGKPTDLYGFRFVDLDKPKAYFPHDPSGTVVARLPKGRFYFESFVQTAKGENDYLDTDYIEPSFEVTGDAELTVDARTGKPVGFHVDQPDAAPGAAITQYAMKAGWGDTGLTSFRRDFTDYTVVPSTKSAGEAFTFTAEAVLAKPDGQGNFHASPYQYHVRESETGSVPATLEWTVADKDLAKVRSTHAASAPGLVGVRDGVASGVLPFSLDEFYTPDVPWYGDFMEVTKVGEFPPVSFQRDLAPRVYQLGKDASSTWNVGVFGPAMPFSADNPGAVAGRLGDDTRINLSLFTDQADGRSGDGTATGKTVLLKDGEQLDESPYPGGGAYLLPPEAATYTMRTEATRDGPLSTKISGEWTFTSSHVDGETPANLPMLAVRFAPELDENNAAPGGAFEFPVYVRRADTDKPVEAKPDVEVSYDDGATWQPVSLKANGSDWTASVEHPAGAKFVSLRTSVTDADGNAAKYSIVRGYAVK